MKDMLTGDWVDRCAIRVFVLAGVFFTSGMGAEITFKVFAEGCGVAGDFSMLKCVPDCYMFCGFFGGMTGLGTGRVHCWVGPGVGGGLKKKLYLEVVLMSCLTS